MIQILLIIGLILVFGYALSQRRRSRPLSAIMMAISLAGCLFVLLPNLTNIVAHALGVGRGADLVLYCFVLVTLLAIFNLHLRFRSAMESTTELARSIAIMSATEPHRAESFDKQH